MSIQLNKNTPRLLSMVRGQQHATSKDHVDEEAIYAEPMSSDDEERAPESPPSPLRSPTPPRPPAEMATKFKSSKSRAQEIPPAKRKSSRNSSIKAPSNGAWAENQMEKKKRKGLDEDKENADAKSSGQSGTGVDDSKEPESGSMFGWEHSTSKRQKANVLGMHAPPSSKSYGGVNKSYGSGTSRDNTAVSRPLAAAKKTTYGKRKVPQLPVQTSDDEDEDSDGLEKIAFNPLLNSKEPRTLKTQPATTSKPSLLELATLLKNQTTSSSRASDSQSTSLPNLDPPKSGASTPRSSLLSSPRHTETLQNLEQYLDELPAETEDANKRCPVCEETVDSNYYDEFWVDKVRNVHHQTLFCKEHKKREAWEDYRQKGYPEMDWTTFPDKIRMYHPRLKAVLQNKRPSHYRDIHAQRLADREERTVRKLLDSDAIFEATTGYYGSRGKRAMMETITSQLGSVIRNCAKRDPVVAFNGIANFVQHVLVPELTVWMVMDDKAVSEAKAKEIVQESGALGEVVNEEVDDKVDYLTSEDDDSAGDAE
ncbi:hypothetical protein K504DRAFT_460641 [Pleomassaria siparia CBS 279.74]|uniref:Restriction of telomere capping protein 4 n=1 Tax=Pleomassaria siparia CBS 279.74 TaxID=1314801 RepID=A0A6G1JYV5_9PLEO|nr:hypothetical protein K504DRAFT_460641 [Pleomassaria siparia CBS 279.74]